MKFSKRTLLKLKNKNKKLKPNKYKKLKREALRGIVKGTGERPRLSVYRSNEHIYVCHGRNFRPSAYPEQ